MDGPPRKLPSKLKYFCQMCNKQCRDQNGFKCHTESGSHMAQMKIFLADPEKFISQFSNEFETHFLSLLGGDWVGGAEVYNELIRDADHTHLNATRWTSLAEFLTDLEKEGKIEKRTSNDQGVGMIRQVDSARDERVNREKLSAKRRVEREKMREQEENEKRLRISQAAVEHEPTVPTRREPGDGKKLVFGFTKSDAKKPTPTTRPVFAFEEEAL